MKLSTAVLGSGAVAHATERNAAHILKIGRDTFSRVALARVDCSNFIAAANLSRAVDALKVKDTADLFDRIPPASLAVPGIGTTALIVLACAFEARGIGGSNPLEAWCHRHTTDERPELVTFHTIKKDVAADAAPRPGAQSKRARKRTSV